MCVLRCAPRGQRTISGFGSLFPPRGSLGLNSGVSFGKRSLPPEPSCQPKVLLVCSQLMVTRFKNKKQQLFVILVEDNKVILRCSGMNSLFNPLRHILTL